MRIWVIFLLLLNIVMAGDLLYLYYVGGWYDPIKVIEVSEVISLYFIAISSLITVVYKVIKWLL